MISGNIITTIIYGTVEILLAAGIIFCLYRIIRNRQDDIEREIEEDERDSMLGVTSHSIIITDTIMAILEQSHTEIPEHLLEYRERLYHNFERALAGEYTTEEYAEDMMELFDRAEKLHNKYYKYE